jgi:hypothetical protein
VNVGAVLGIGLRLLILLSWGIPALGIQLAPGGGDDGPQHIELSGDRVWALHRETAGSVTAGDQSKFFLHGGRAGIITANHDSAVTIDGGTFSEIRAGGNSIVEMRAGSSEDPDAERLRPPRRHPPPSFRVEDEASVTMTGGRIIGPIVVRHSGTVTLKGGIIAANPHARITASDDAKVHVHGIRLHVYRKGKETAIGGTLVDGTVFSMPVQVQHRAAIFLYEPQGVTSVINAPVSVPSGGKRLLGPRTAAAPRPPATSPRGLFAPLAALFLLALAGAAAPAALLLRNRRPSGSTRVIRFAVVVALALLVAAGPAVALSLYLSAPSGDEPQPSIRLFAPRRWTPQVALAVVVVVILVAAVRHRLSTLFAWTCLLLFAGSSVLWARSYRRADELARRSISPSPGVNSHRTIGLSSGGGGVRLHVRSYPAGNGIPQVHRADLATRVEWEVRSASTPDAARYVFTDDDVASAGPFARRWGLLLLDGSKSTNFPPHLDRQTTVAVPYWLITLPWAIPPLLYLQAKARRSQRIARNCCPSCGYDLRASAGRCPECGAGSVAQESGSSLSAPSPA